MDSQPQAIVNCEKSPTGKHDNTTEVIGKDSPRGPDGPSVFTYRHTCKYCGYTTTSCDRQIGFFDW